MPQWKWYICLNFYINLKIRPMSFFHKGNCTSVQRNLTLSCQAPKKSDFFLEKGASKTFLPPYATSPIPHLSLLHRHKNTQTLLRMCVPLTAHMRMSSDLPAFGIGIGPDSDQGLSVMH